MTVIQWILKKYKSQVTFFSHLAILVLIVIVEHWVRLLNIVEFKQWY